MNSSLAVVNHAGLAKVTLWGGIVFVLYLWTAPCSADRWQIIGGDAPCCSCSGIVQGQPCFQIGGGQVCTGTRDICAYGSPKSGVCAPNPAVFCSAPLGCSGSSETCTGPCNPYCE